MEVRLSHLLKLSDVRLERFPILSGNETSLEDPLKVSERRLDRFPIFSDKDSRLSN